jgi:hypothetical protein
MFKKEDKMITEDVIVRTKKLMKKHLPNSEKYQTHKFAKEYLELYLKVKDKVKKNKEVK